MVLPLLNREGVMCPGCGSFSISRVVKDGGERCSCLTCGMTWEMSETEELTAEVEVLNPSRL